MKSAVRTLGWRVSAWDRQWGGGWKLHISDPVHPFCLTVYSDTKIGCLRRAVERAQHEAVTSVLNALS